MDGDIEPRTAEKVAMVFVGMINNVFFLIVMSSAQRIVKHFNATGLLSVVDWSCTFCGLFAGYINTWLSSCSVSYDLRFTINSISMAIGLLGVALAPNFTFSCISILFIGFACNFGESVTLGYVAFIRKQSLIKFWSIGTGTAGIFGSLYTVICLLVGFNYTYSFYALLPFVLIYIYCYFFVLREKKLPINEKPLISQETETDEVPISCCNCGLIKKLLYYIFTCDGVYFAQYSIAIAFLDCAQTEEITKKYTFLFPMLSMTQHVGVLIFCASLNLFEFKRLGLLAGFQLANFTIWLTQAMLHWMPVWSEFFFIFLVGSVGGLSYANTYHMILNDKQLNAKEKELGTNITAFSVTVVVLVSSGFSLLSEKTYLKPFVPK